MTDTQYAALDTNKINYIDDVGGDNVIINGYCLSGEWIHVQRNIQWLIVKSTLVCLDILKENDIVGHDTDGYSIFVDDLDTFGDAAEAQGIFVRNTSGAQLTADPTEADKIAQTLKNLELFGTIRYGINTVTLSLRLSV
jgi:hypothetical protein